MIFLITGMSLLLPSIGRSCPIPVYRYALEYWEADPYSIEIFYKNALDPEDEKKINNFLITSDGNGIKVNLEIKKINVAGNIDDALRRYLDDIKPSGFPWVVLRYPYLSGINKILWSGLLSQMNMNNILYSPARMDISVKLAGGATSVWVLLECGDRKKDEAAYNLLEKELRRLEQTLKLPDPELWWDTSKGATDEQVPRIKFEIVRVSRNDPVEEHLVNMLLYSEKDLTNFESEPMIFPIYGRGIALYAIVSKGINEWNITEAASFLTGPCSCQAKLLNPGTDLLISMDWDRLIDRITDINIANPLSGIGDFSSREEEVKKQLELATIKRLGTSSKDASQILSDAEKAVLKDASGKDDLNIQDEPEVISLDGKPLDFAKVSNNRSKKQDLPESRQLSDNDAQQLLSIDKENRISFLKMPVFIFSGGIILILLIGLIIYKKAIK